MSARKGWCFTLNNYTQEHIYNLRDLIDGTNIAYLVFGREVGEQGTAHLQGYLHLSSKKRFNYVKDLLPGNPHIEGAKGTPSQNRTYCTKDGDFEEFGSCPGGQGSRSDLAEACELVKDGKRLRDIVETHPTVVAKYFRGLSVIRGLRPRKPRPKPTVWVLWGEAGSGKTYSSRQLANDQATDSEIYSHRGGKWWADYDGEKCVIFNDFTGSCISASNWCRLIDTEPFPLEFKGGSAWAEFTHLFISSNYPPFMWWNLPLERMRAAMRRIDKCIFIGFNGQAKSYENAVWTPHHPSTVPQQAASYMQGIEPQPLIGPIQHITGDNL
jgi:hypothetical protein